jgi:predicted enzyme related to lactoylglutathione lyase
MPATVTTIVFDCADPAALAEFYGAATGWQVSYQDDDTVQLGDGGPIRLGFQRVPDHRPAAWPGPGKQAHLDLRVSDLADATDELLALGATRPDHQPGNGDWVVLADPAGHVFCLIPSEQR